MTVDAVLEVKRGLIVAPAGCGKTHLITEALNISQSKRYLVLTHTTAGVAALKQRLNRLGVPSKNYVVSTIDGWAQKIASAFSMSCDIKATPESPRDFYPELRQKVDTFVAGNHIADIIQSSYTRLLVDEYQDCDADQHRLICSLSKYLPTIVFGDPMQCIFNFGGPMPIWERDVQSIFPIISELNTPWRWINSGAPDLGHWILDCRNLLLQGAQVDLSSLPKFIDWKQLVGDYQSDLMAQVQAQYVLRNRYDEAESLLVIGDQFRADLRHDFASVTHGIDVVEPVDLTDITSFASDIDRLSGINLADQTLSFLSTMMTGIGKANLMKRINSILAGRNRTPATLVELAVKAVIEQGDVEAFSSLLDCLERSPETRIFRVGAFLALKNAVSLSLCDPSKTILRSIEVVREKRRHQGDRRISIRAIGSTLLLKGLEADHSLILDAGAMNTHNLYVALSRGAKSITVFSSNQMVG